MNTTTTYHKVSHIEFDFVPDASDPSFSFLRFRIYSPKSSTRSHTICLFASSAHAADHLFDIFHALSALPDLWSGKAQKTEEPIELREDKLPATQKEKEKGVKE